MPVPIQDSERSCICVLRVSTWPLSTILLSDFGTAVTALYILFSFCLDPMDPKDFICDYVHQHEDSHLSFKYWFLRIYIHMYLFNFNFPVALDSQGLAQEICTCAINIYKDSIGSNTLVHCHCLERI